MRYIEISELEAVRGGGIRRAMLDRPGKNPSSGDGGACYPEPNMSTPSGPVYSGGAE